MATGFNLVAISLKCNNNDLLVVRQLILKALNIADESPAYKKASSASCAANLLALSRQDRQEPDLATSTHALHFAGGNMDLFSHGSGHLQHARLTKPCAEIINQWRNPAKQVRKCWSSFTYSLVDVNFDTFPEYSSKFLVSASRDLAART